MVDTFTIHTKNDSVIVIQELASPTLPGIFLALIFMAGLCINVVLVFTIASSVTLRRVTFNCMLLQLCIVSALECLLNVTASLVYLTSIEQMARNHAEAARVFCRVNVALTQLVLVVQSLVLAGITAERALSLCCQSAKDVSASGSVKARFDVALRKIFPGASWLYGVLLAVPIVVSSHMVEIRSFPHRYSCGVVRSAHERNDPEDLIYPSLLLVLGDLLPWLVITTALTAIARHISAERRRQRQLEEAALQRSGHGSTLWTTRGATSSMSWSTLLVGNSCWDDAHFYLIAGLLLLAYLVLLVPHILSVHIAPFAIVMPAPDTTLSNATNTTTNIPPQLRTIATGIYDVIFIWCRYKFTVLAPIIILKIHKEVRKKCGHLFCCCCCRNNSVMHLDEARSISASLEKKVKQHNDKKIKTEEKKRKKKDKYRRLANYRTPVLFATSEGMHLRLVDDREDESVTGGNDQQHDTEPQFLCEFCDLAIMTSTPIESGVNPGTSMNQSFGNNIKRSQKQPPRFGHDSVREQDIRISDHRGDGGNVRNYNSFRKPTIIKEEEYVPVKRKRKPNAKSVRFAHKVDEIPLTESGVWSASEEHEPPLSKKRSNSTEPLVPSTKGNRTGGRYSPPPRLNLSFRA